GAHGRCVCAELRGVGRAVGIGVDHLDLAERRNLGHVDDVPNRDGARSDVDLHPAIHGVVAERVRASDPRRGGQGKPRQSHCPACGACHGATVTPSEANAAWATGTCSGGSIAAPVTAVVSRPRASATRPCAAAIMPAWKAILGSGVPSENAWAPATAAPLRSPDLKRTHASAS